MGMGKKAGAASAAGRESAKNKGSGRKAPADGDRAKTAEAMAPGDSGAGLSAEEWAEALSRADPAVAASAARALRKAGREEIAEYLGARALCAALASGKAPSEETRDWLPAALRRRREEVLALSRSGPKALGEIRKSASRLSPKEAQALEADHPGILSAAAPRIVAAWPNLAGWALGAGALEGKRLRSALAEASKSIAWSQKKRPSARAFAAACLAAAPERMESAARDIWRLDEFACHGILSLPEFGEIAGRSFRAEWEAAGLQRRGFLARQARGSVAYARGESLARALGAELGALAKKDPKGTREAMRWSRREEQAEPILEWGSVGAFGPVGGFGKIRDPSAGLIPLLGLIDRGILSAYGDMPERAAAAFWEGWAKAGGPAPEIALRKSGASASLWEAGEAKEKRFGVEKVARLALENDCEAGALELLRAYAADPEKVSEELGEVRGTRGGKRVGRESAEALILLATAPPPKATRAPRSM